MLRNFSFNFAFRYKNINIFKRITLIPNTNRTSSSLCIFRVTEEDFPDVRLLGVIRCFYSQLFFFSVLALMCCEFNLINHLARVSVLVRIVSGLSHVKSRARCKAECE